jgi:hypothetical protein
MSKEKVQTMICDKTTQSNMNTTKSRGELWCSGRVRSSCSTSDISRITVKRQEHHLICKSCWTPVYVNYKYK